MKNWLSRPKEEAYLFNPTFCCTTLSVAIQNYTSVRGDGLPFPLAFMILPIVLHKPTRESLPPNTRTSMAAWLQENSEARILFYERLVSLKPHTREAIQFGMLHGWVKPTTGGLLETILSNAEVTRSTRTLSGESRECVMRARFVGKWFAEGGETHTTMAFWGVRP